MNSYTWLTNPAGDKLGDLGAEIENQDLLMGHCSLWKGTEAAEAASNAVTALNPR